MWLNNTHQFSSMCVQCHCVRFHYWCVGSAYWCVGSACVNTWFYPMYGCAICRIFAASGDISSNFTDLIFYNDFIFNVWISYLHVSRNDLLVDHSSLQTSNKNVFIRGVANSIYLWSILMNLSWYILVKVMQKRYTNLIKILFHCCLLYCMSILNIKIKQRHIYIREIYNLVNCAGYNVRGRYLFQCVLICVA